MSNDPIRFLHLSDFHIEKEDWALQRLLEKIIDYCRDRKSQGFIPDLIFITGDIANHGTKKEYEIFHKEFFLPLVEALGGTAWKGKIVGVPGNHDVARPGQDVLDQRAAVRAGSRFFDA